MSAFPRTRTQEGTVTRVSRGEYAVRTENGTFSCKLRGKLRKELIYSTSKSRAPRVQRVLPTQTRSPVSVGDRVRIRELSPNTAVIEEILRNDDETWGLLRQAPESKRAHVLAANIDQAVIVLAASQPAPDFLLLDRYLVIAEYHTLPACLVLNKFDRGISREVAEELSVYERIGYKILQTSAATGSGIASLREELRGKQSVFTGVSGVGKSSLINCLAASAALPTGAVGAKGEGRHITTRTETIALDDESHVLDTPGLRKLSSWSIEPEDLPHLFPEVRALMGQCRFRDCVHIDEPGCAVRSAQETGTMTPRRYKSYVLFHFEFTEQNLTPWEQA
ncbi:MAG: ribosome small subunit-dependent GTPase A [Chloroflexi bacterium]|nr:ribosome small subunit-dependent GTPase A [Chloroflexota bacterium]